MDKDSILITTDGPIGIISLNNPEKKNAVTNQMLKEIDHVLQQMEESGIRAVVLTGAGDRIFCSGYDVTTFSGALSDLEEAAAGGEKTDYLRLTLRRIQNIGMPVIAMINGHCIGAGVDISLACDFRYAAAGVRFQVPPARLGIIYNPDGIRRAINILGLARAKELFFLGESVSAEAALAMGFLNGVHPMEKLAEHTMGIARTLAENAPLSLRGMKKVFRYCLEHQGLSREREAEVEQLIIDAMRSEDAAEALKAFSERRKPQFKGR
ncbi:MAG: enoyl-CoA hydratase/isomerase family protein [Desulfomonile tiedjei]|nr:enoyl-CoA hydratase/isomerase family protein [Desulfomonile tiedjei]